MRLRDGLLRLLVLCTAAGVLVAGMLFPVAGGLGVLSNRASETVDNISGDLNTVQPPLVATLTDSEGKPFARLFDQYRLPARSEEIAQTMKAAIIAVEDRRFYQHAGVDWRGTLRAAINDTTGGSTQGASTITQQYVKNYLVNVVDRNDPVEKQKDQEQTLARKLREARIAMQVEQRMTKEQILTGYLNVVAFGARTYGIGAAAKVFYGVEPSELTVPQSALLAGIVNNPISLNPWDNPQEALQRRNSVIDRMVENASITKEQGEQAKDSGLGIKPREELPSASCIGARRDAGFFCDYVTQYLAEAGFSYDDILTGGYTIKTSLNSKLSITAKRNVETRVRKAEPGLGHSFAVVKPGKDNHQVAAMTSNRDYGPDLDAGESLSNQVSGVSNVYGGGSSFKVFTAAAGMESGKVGLQSSLNNPQVTTVCPPIKPSTCSAVSNLGEGSDPGMSLRTALAQSPNTGFVNLALDTGLPRVLKMAERLGLRKTMQTNVYGGDTETPTAKKRGDEYTKSQLEYYTNVPVFTLGFSPVSPLEMSNVSATLMSKGKWCKPNPILEVRDRNDRVVDIPQQPCEQVISPALADSLMAGLSDDSISGTSAAAAGNAGWNRPDIGKTGTTQENKSVSFVGGVNDYGVASMVFADGAESAPICATVPATLGCVDSAFGGTLAAPTFFDTFSAFLAGQPSKPIPPPDPAFESAQPHGPIVPYVSGLPQGRAMRVLKNTGFKPKVEQFNSPRPKGTVVGQTPQGNIGKNTPVTLFVSTGNVPKLR